MNAKWLGWLWMLAAIGAILADMSRDAVYSAVVISSVWFAADYVKLAAK